MKKIPVIMTFLLFMGLHAYSQPLQTVDQVDIEKYMGRWYDIASYPAPFLKGCRCTTADYEIVPGKKFIRVTNRCIRFKNGRSKIITSQGKAFVVKGSKNTKLKVQFFWPFRGDYYIIGLADDYSWAIVGHPTRKYLWILSRDSFIPTDTYNYILKITGEQGYDVNRLIKTSQNCDSAK
ncbi:MAG: lipocalin family protein [Bacteroidales bacterium]|nr:lipocalin family protein [Bacteroidales bacterium]